MNRLFFEIRASISFVMFYEVSLARFSSKRNIREFSDFYKIRLEQNENSIKIILTYVLRLFKAVTTHGHIESHWRLKKIALYKFYSLSTQ